MKPTITSQKNYQENSPISATWRNVNDYLQTSKSSFSNNPSIIKHNGQTFTAPREIANAINETFIKKVKDLRDQVDDTVDIDPIERLRKFLKKRTEQILEFQLKKITLVNLRNR